MKVIVVGGVAGGMSAAARLRRPDESAELVVLERGRIDVLATAMAAGPPAPRRPTSSRPPP
ncbi:hypothetical protein FNQ90_22670, partial [Streptomyces alkaliphilus]|nr:hypothetical protein [Streptomyces alkaliphilus]